MGQKFSSLEYGNCQVLPNAPTPMQCLIDEKVNFKKKFGSTHLEISIFSSKSGRAARGMYFRNFWLGMCRREPGTLENLKLPISVFYIFE